MHYTQATGQLHFELDFAPTKLPSVLGYDDIDYELRLCGKKRACSEPRTKIAASTQMSFSWAPCKRDFRRKTFVDNLGQAHSLSPLSHTLGARKCFDWLLRYAPGNGKVDNYWVFALARVCRYNRRIIDAVGCIQR